MQASPGSPKTHTARNTDSSFSLSYHRGADIGAILKSVVGGEIGYFTRMMYSARNEALERLVGECMGRGGNAIIALR
jgi:uncharacterized protein YbjQ (UPF0145 family)